MLRIRTASAGPIGRACIGLAIALALVAPVAASAVTPPTPVVQQQLPDGHVDVPPAAAKPREQHWAWQPLADPTPPAIANVAHPVDRFVRARLAAAGLGPAEPADPAVLLRRLHLDLVGLPPTPEQVARFVADPSDRAYRAEVDRLLASPQHAERLARHWLDLVRYCETLGHEYDFEIPNAWRYRDYLIRAFRDDVPYDQIIREHIAGDLLDPPRRDADGNNESVQATASWWFVEQTHSPVDAMQHTADRIDNQIDVLGKAFLGTTVACARCHDHKFDPIPTRDYYGLFGYVQSSRYVQTPIRCENPRSSGYQRVLNAQRVLRERWLPDVVPPLASGVSLRPEDTVIASATTAGAGGDPLLLGDGDGPIRQQWFVVGDAFGERPWQGAVCVNPDTARPQLVRLPGPFWHSAAAGADREGTLMTRTFEIRERYLHVRVAGRESRINLVIDGMHVVRDPIYGTLHRGVHDPLANWQTFDLEMWRGQTAYLQATDVRAPDLGDAERNRGRWADDGWLALQMVVLSPHGAPPPSVGRGEVLPSDAVRADADWRQARRELAAAVADLPIAPTVPSIADGTGIDSHVFLRGNHKTPGEPAPRRFLSLLDGSTQAPAPRDGSGRLHLAEAVLAADNPLPPRVLVNRLWHHLFGRGIVASVDNFGALGDRPSHPELLDWLARDFVAHGWSVRHTLRLLCTSETYRQASRRRGDAEEIDADNLLLHRQNVRPLEAGALRDALLAVSGRLSDEMFGPSIEQPREAITEARGRPTEYGPRDGGGRRTVYLAMRRNFMPRMLLAFDLPTPFATVGRRNTSNVPAQALALANAPLVHELCGSFAERVIAEVDVASANTDDARIDRAYLLALGRTPEPEERRRVRAFLVERQDDEPAQTWFDICHALVNTTEFRFRR